MISPTFSFLPTLNRTSPSTNSSPHRTDTKTYPHSSPTPRSLKTEPRSNLRCIFLFHLSRLIPFHSSTGPSVCWSPFHISYAFLLCLPCHSTSVLQSWLFVPCLLSVSYHFSFPFLIDSAMWKPTLSLT